MLHKNKACLRNADRSEPDSNMPKRGAKSWTASLKEDGSWGIGAELGLETCALETDFFACFFFTYGLS